MRPYNFAEIEAKWQHRWAESDLYAVDPQSTEPAYYFLLMFPYPSGPLHSGHWYMYGPPDAKARYLRMSGKNLLFPMGFDAFGLPAENAAIKRNIHPKQWTVANIQQMRESFRRMGASFDWSREVVTCDPAYYRWTQWLFLQLFKHGLAYRILSPVDFCPSCNTTLAREQIVGDDRHCERCQTPVYKRELKQWFFRITRYADELLDFSGVDWPERVRTMQTHWIGRTEGTDIHFKVDEQTHVTVFTTRADTLFGATFLAIAPEHPLLAQLVTETQAVAVEAYVAEARRQAETDRLSTVRVKTGVFTGAYAQNPTSAERLPIFVSDYVPSPDA